MINFYHRETNKGPEMTKTIIARVPIPDHKALKMLCASNGESINERIVKLVQDYIREHKAKVA